MNFIYSPETKKQYLLQSNKGKKILLQYVKSYMEGGIFTKKKNKPSKQCDSDINCSKDEYCKQKKCVKKPENTNLKYFDYKYK